jgi:alpha-L-rhamnosidase
MKNSLTIPVILACTAFIAWTGPLPTALENEAEWQGAEWISSTQKTAPQFAPQHLMGPWIAGKAATAEPVFAFDFQLPDKPVVYAGAWWGTSVPAQTTCTANGAGAAFTFRKNAPHYTDFAFCLRPGENRIELTLTDVPKNTAISFGMQVIFADGSEQVVQSSKHWKTTGQPVEPVCEYGEKPFGTAEVYSLSPLPAAWFKKDFELDRPVASARLYLCGLGYSEAYLNGAKVGDHVLDPGQADYQTEALYQTFDITDALQRGDNTLAVMLGDGWYNQDRAFSTPGYRYGQPGLRALLSVQFKDGSSQTLISDDSWMWCESEIRMANVYLGEHIDFREQHAEWTAPGFSNHWKNTKNVPPLSPKLKAQDFPPIRKIRDIQPVRMWQTGAKTWCFDLGENISGWVRLKFNEPVGTVIRIRCSEMLDADSRFLVNAPTSFWNCHGAPQHHELICDGKPHDWEPRFSYHGFRYFEISGLSRAPQTGDVTGVVVHTDVPVTASFESSDPLLNRIFDMGIRSHLDNMHSILEDCPHREKCMWGGDLHASWAVGFRLLDAASFYRQCVNLYYTPPFAPDGIPGNIGVGQRIARGYSDFSWVVSPLFLSWRLYTETGDLETARTHYPHMLHLLKQFEKTSPDLIPEKAAHGDHAAAPEIERNPQDKRLIAAMNFFAAADRFAGLAEALNRPDEAAWSRDLAKRIRTSILKNYYNAGHHTFGNGSQDSLALAFGIPVPEEHQAVAQSLALTYRKNGKKFDGGFMSYNIYSQLAENGEVDLALDMLRNPNYPGIAWSIKNHDATTIWEVYRQDPLFQSSHNHHAMNHPSAWLVTHVAGIQSSYKQLILEPFIPRDLERAAASVQTPQGTVKSSWEQTDTTVRWDIVIPPNRTAEIRFPEEADRSAETLPAGSWHFEWNHPE